MKDQIAHWLARGFKADKVATIVGCTPAYISQLQTGDEEFPALLEKAKKAVERSKEEDAIEDDYVKLEASVVAQVKENLPFAEFGDLTRLMQTLIQRKQKAPNGSIVSNITQNNNTVVLQIPTAVAPEIMLNKQKEIIAIDGRTLAPMPSVGVRSLFKGIKDKREAETIDVTTIRELPEDF